MKTVELLAPAGTEKSLRYALAYGADAVYAGVPSFSLRARNNPFTIEKLVEAIAYTHHQGKKLYVTANIYPRNDKIKPFLATLGELISSAPVAPDALIMADPGLIMLAREQWPEIPIHLSVQANTLNHAAVSFWQRVGVSRIILSRELSLDEIEWIRQSCPEIELEVFVHGALCISYSGRCLLSGYFAHRDANQGTCANSCRWNYALYSNIPAAITAGRPDADETLPHVCAPRIGTNAPPLYWLEESQRPGEMMPISEDEHGTYILNSRDLCAIEHVQRLVQIGVNSLKIEGRTKSHYYVARATAIYRQAINAALRGESFDPAMKTALLSLAHRGYTDGFLGDADHAERQNYTSNRSVTGTHRFVGEIIQTLDGWMEIDVKNQFSCGEEMLLITPHGDHPFTLRTLRDSDQQTISIARGSGHRVWCPCPVSDPGEYALLLRCEPESVSES